MQFFLSQQLSGNSHQTCASCRTNIKFTKPSVWNTGMFRARPWANCWIFDSNTCLLILFIIIHAIYIQLQSSATGFYLLSILLKYWFAPRIAFRMNLLNIAVIWQELYLIIIVIGSSAEHFSIKRITELLLQKGVR